MDISKKIQQTLSSAPYYRAHSRIGYLSPSVLPEIMLEKMNMWEHFLGAPGTGDMSNFQGGIYTLVKEREI